RGRARTFRRSRPRANGASHGRDHRGRVPREDARPIPARARHHACARLEDIPRSVSLDRRPEGTVTVTPRRFTLLLTSAGRRCALLECSRESGRELGLELRLLAADAHPATAPACALADAAFPVPACTTEGYVDALTA